MSISDEKKMRQELELQQDGGAFLDNARSILATAENVFFSTGTLEETTILIAPEGTIRLVSESDWSLESLRVHHGALMAYRVSQRDGRVHVEGRAGSRTCLFEAEKPNGAALLLLANNARNYDCEALPLARLGAAGPSGSPPAERLAALYAGPAFPQLCLAA